MPHYSSSRLTQIHDPNATVRGRMGTWLPDERGDERHERGDERGDAQR